MKKNKTMIFLFILPTVLCLLFMYVYPVVRTVIMSFFKVESLTATPSTWSFYGDVYKRQQEDTTVYTGEGSSFTLHRDANEIKWYNPVSYTHLIAQDFEIVLQPIEAPCACSCRKALYLKETHDNRPNDRIDIHEQLAKNDGQNE